MFCAKQSLLNFGAHLIMTVSNSFENKDFVFKLTISQLVPSETVE